MFCHYKPREIIICHENVGLEVFHFFCSSGRDFASLGFMEQTAPKTLPPAPVKTQKRSFPEAVIHFWACVFKFILPQFMINFFLRIDRRVDGAITFFIKNYGKSRFMIAMSKKAQVLGIEKLWNKSPKAFVYFFMYYLIRDSILYIIIPIYIASRINS
jgi:hypothetical protein